MTIYKPERWCVIKITPKDQKPLYKVFGSWYEGNFYGDQWRLNSGITKATLKDCEYQFEGYSGSVYRCNEICYGTTGYGAFILSDMKSKVEQNGGTLEVLPEDTNWIEVNYESKS